ncbi:MAG: hypothetical protein AAB402_02420 [Patescibacteria group bacterium]
MADPLEERVRESLLAFVDFLYAVVFGLIVAKLFDEVVHGQDNVLDKIGKVGLVGSVFYFLTWDWLHGRLLTLKNSYRGYWRFFIEILIACCGYGAAEAAVTAKVSVIGYVAAILLLGAWWARIAVREHPASQDLYEFRFLSVYQAICSAALIALLASYYIFVGQYIPWWVAIPFNLIGALFVFLYELKIERPIGVLGGPGVPFIHRDLMMRIRKMARSKTSLRRR